VRRGTRQAQVSPAQFRTATVPACAPPRPKEVRLGRWIFLTSPPSMMPLSSRSTESKAALSLASSNAMAGSREQPSPPSLPRPPSYLIVNPPYVRLWGLRCRGVRASPTPPSPGTRHPFLDRDRGSGLRLRLRLSLHAAAAFYAAAALLLLAAAAGCCSSTASKGQQLRVGKWHGKSLESGCSVCMQSGLRLMCV
jgi:hypothetical protein